MYEKVLRIFELCMQLNPTETQQKVTGDKPTVFLWFSGHVNRSVEVSIHKSGWRKQAHHDLQYEINPSEGTCMRCVAGDCFGVASSIDACIAELESLL